MNINRIHRLNGEIQVPGDKSISHRGVMMGSIAEGKTEIRHFLQGADCLSTISCFQQMGIDIQTEGDAVHIIGRGLHGLRRPAGPLDCGNSGTTMRLMSGILSAQDFDSELTGDDSIKKRPMRRVIDPLSRMGAQIDSQDGCAPLRIHGRRLHGMEHQMEVASAQVKSAILLAGLYADGPTSVLEPAPTRNHSEIMLRQFGAELINEGNQVWITPPDRLYGCDIHVPGDISSAAYFLAAGLLAPQSEILIRRVGVNPTRDGILQVLQEMGGSIEKLNLRVEGGEPVCDLLVKSSRLHGVTISGSIIPTLIDELPVIAVLAAFAEGETVIRDAAELKVKESNRIDSVTFNLKSMGADVTATEDGMTVRGGKPLRGAVIDSRLDHRIAMSFAVAGLCADGETQILGAECVDISYPGFFRDLQMLSH